MIIKSMSRKSGGTGQLFDYLFRYMLAEEKRKGLSPQLRSLAQEAGKYKSSRSFEKALRERGRLKYAGLPSLQGRPLATKAVTEGKSGKALYLYTERQTAKRHTGKAGVVLKFFLREDLRLLTIPLSNTSNKNYTNRETSQNKTNVSTNISLKPRLINQGFSGLQTKHGAVLFKLSDVLLLPDDFFKMAKLAPNSKETVENQFTMCHNVRARSVAGYAREFERNEANRVRKQKNAVQVYHTIISFSNKDKEHITNTLLADISKKYVELRGKDCKYVFTSHHDKDHIHLHCAMSGTRLNGKASRISHKEFASLKEAMDAYQKEKYPELVNSLPKHGKAKLLEKREHLENTKNAERTKDRTKLLEVLDVVYKKSASKKQFYLELKTLGHEPYE